MRQLLGPERRCPQTGAATYQPVGDPLEVEPVAALGGLVRALEVHDPGAARRGVLRAIVIDQVGDALGLDASTAAVSFAAALLSDLGVLLTHSQPRADDVAFSQLAATLLDRLPGLAAVANAIRHAHERWDGGGGPHGLSEQGIPLPARVVALARVLVGPVSLDALPTWPARCGRARALAGSVLDPDLVATAIAKVLESPPSGPFSVERALELLRAATIAETGRTPVDALRDIGAAIRAAHRLDEVLVLIGDYARRALDASTVSIGRRDADQNTLQVLVNVGELDERTERFPTDDVHLLSAFPPFTGFAAGTEHVLMRLGDDPAVMRYLEQRGISSEIATPIVIDGTAWGMVWASSRPARHPLSTNDLDTLRVAAAQLAIGIEHTERFAGLVTLALRDPLTGLGNRRVLDDKLRELFRRQPLDRHDSALVMCDVDELKIINDTLGHAFGDRVLIDVAEALRTASVNVPTATICRIGGDEFCVFLDRGGLLYAQAIADHAQRLVSRADPRRSVSCGVAIVDDSITTPSQLLRAADVAQYEQKRARKTIFGGRAPESEESAAARRRARRDH